MSEMSEVVDLLSESMRGGIFIKSSDLETLLSQNHVEYMIIGAHALGELTGEPRATQDVDLIVKQSDFDRVVGLILGAYPGTHAIGNRIKDPHDQVLVDILTDTHPIYKTALASGGRIPDIETMLVMKYLSNQSPLRRKDRKIQDQADFFNLARSPSVNKDRVIELLQSSCKDYELHRDRILQWIDDAQS